MPRSRSSIVRHLLGGDGGPAPLRQELTERTLPALVFGTLAVASGASALGAAGQGAAEPGLAEGVVHGLGVAHRGLTALFCGLVAALFSSRRTPRGRRATRSALAVALAGTFVMGVVPLHPPTTDDWRVLALANSLLVGGLAFSIYAAVSLRWCFGLAAEPRGLVTGGAYRLVRHPLYLGELVAAAGVLLPVLAAPTALIFGVFCLCQLTRAVLEERVLAAAFPAYREYRRQTPALLPWPRPRPSRGFR